MGWLPTPLELSAAGAALMVAAALVGWFLHLVRIALYLAAAGMVLLFAASVAYGYKKQGIDEIQPKLDIANAKLEQAYARATEFRAAAVEAQATAVRQIKAREAQLAVVAKALGDKINEQDKVIRDLRIPAAAGVFVNSVIDDVERAARGPGVDASAAPVAPLPGDTTLGAVEQWSGDVVVLYGRATSQIAGLQKYITDLRTASVAAQPTN